MEQIQNRYMVILLTVPNATAANQLTEQSLRLDPAFNKISGISVAEVSNGGIPNNYRVGARDTRKTWVDPVNIQNLQAGSAVAPDDKYLTVNIPYNDGDAFYANVFNLALLTSNLVIEVTLRLEKDLTEINK